MNKELALKDLIDELFTSIIANNKKIESSSCKAGVNNVLPCNSNIEFENDCNMWILQLKSFVFDALADKNKKDSQTLIKFLDELNKISIVY
jgi:aminopeptidase-like protein